jgi:hypothetical protein
VEAGQPIVGEPVPDAVAVGFRQRLVASLVRVVDEPEMQFEAVDLPFHRGVAEAAVVIAELDERGVDRPARQVETSAPEDAAFSFPFEQHCPDSLVYPFRQLTHIDLQHLAASHVEFGDVAMASIRSQMFKDHWHHNWNY